MAEAAGRYLVRVYGWDGAENVAVLAVAVEDPAPEPEPEPTGDDRFEENDDQAAAAELPGSGDYGDLVIDGDDDWFVVEVPAGGVEVAIAFRHADGDLDLALHDGAGRRLERSQGVADEEVVRHAGSGGRVWVRVYGYAGAGGDYSVSIR